VQYPHAIGKSVVLVGALQARNNARVLITGSMHMFSDEFLTAAVNQFGSKEK
jgi:oligosaccharyltransferase complex subunit beta